MHTYRRSDKKQGKKNYIHAMICLLHCVACVYSSLCYGLNSLDLECLQGKCKFFNITSHWRYRVKYMCRPTHFQTRPYFEVSLHYQDSVVLLRRKQQGTQCYRGMMYPRFGLDGRGEEKISYTHRGSNPKSSIP